MRKRSKVLIILTFLEQLGRFPSKRRYLTAPYIACICFLCSPTPKS